MKPSPDWLNTMFSVVVAVLQAKFDCIVIIMHIIIRVNGSAKILLSLSILMLVILVEPYSKYTRLAVILVGRLKFNVGLFFL